MQRRTFAVPLVIALSLALFGLWAQGAVPDVPTGQWLPGPTLAQPRAGAVSVALDDGRVLVIGGRTSQGPVDTVEVLNADGSMTVAAPLLQPRAGHAAVALPNGLVLVSGGTTVVQGNSGAIEVVTGSAELYDAAGNVWYPWWPLQVARSGHTATALPDGRVLVAGGIGAQGTLDSLEVFDPVTMEFASSGILSAPRSQHAAALTGKTQVLLAGGRNATGVLATADLVDVNTGAVAQVTLTTVRADATATTLLDGRIFIAGGSDGANDLASTEVVDPVAGVSTPAASMAYPRRGHEALLLPDNATVLVTGGTNGGTVITSAELYVPWNDAFLTTGQPAIPRADAALSALGEGVTLLAGGRAADGSAVAQSELYGFATVRTDKDDYAPGTPVVITGSGWQPGETVTLTLQEIDPQHDDRTLSAIADASGHIRNASFAPEEHDIGVRFYLTARGAGAQARTTFSDGTARIDSVSITPFSPNQPSSIGVKDTTNIVGENQGGGNIASFSIRIRPLSNLALVVRTFTVGPLAANTMASPVTWDGKDSANAFVADGIYLARAVDGSTENTAGNATKTIVVDNTNPVVTLVAPADNEFRRTAVDFEANPIDANGTDKVEFYVDGGLVGTDTSSSGGWKVTNISLAEGNHTWFAKAFDPAGNNTTSGTRTVRVDLTDPAVSVDPVANGAVNSPLTITGTATDLPAVSGYGIASVQVTISGPAGTIGSAVNTGTNFSTWSFAFTPTAGGNYTVQARATDQAGNSRNSNTRSFTVSADSTPPVITPNVTGTLGTNGWYISDVTVSWSVSDPDSAVTNSTSCGTITITTDTAGTTLTCSATSAGGSASQSVTIKRDATAPGITLVSVLPAANAHGWRNTDVIAMWSCSDAVSGVVNATAQQTVATEGANQSATGTCTDLAGNSSTDTQVGINIDRTSPSATASVSPAANANGWHNANVTVSFSGSDGLSGIDVCSADVVLTSDGVGQSASGTCTDKAGNVSAPATASGINIDKTAPGITLVSVLPAANAHGWRNVDVTATWSCSDTLSGVVSATAQQTVTTEGANQSAIGTCTDLAGNDSTDTQNGINVDKTAPSATASVSPAANANGWHNANVTVSFSGGDGLSGIDVCSANVVLTAEGAGQSGSGTCTDKAGNVSTSATASDINIDKTVPGITLVSVLPAANAHGWRNVDVTATWSCSDTLSGAVSATTQQTVTTEGANQSASATCTDKAGNVTSDTQTGISIDKTAPGLNPSVTPNPVLLNGAATAAGGGTDALAGIATQSCGAVDAASVGSKTLTCTVTDKAGNSSTADASYSVQYASGGYCLGNPGRQILQPVNADGSSVFKKGSTVPAKFRVCDANGASVGLAGVVTSFRLIQTVNGTVAEVDEPVISTTPDTAFRWSASDQQWIFNMNTKGLIANTTYVFRITLNDPGTPIDFRFGLK